MSIVVHETSGAILLLTAYKPGDKFGALQIDLSTDKVLSFQPQIRNRPHKMTQRSKR